ncbi:dihydrolipoamide acetyltransferase family protein [Pseudanabaena galeata UHCC 0370]|jgi:pyruvate dehydrogenase E2 component (dihydrolipoamide acetyltransferase)|uniref:Dihydrolipoamide acetyltransferase component of pyruvate dehydrogenase complex n=1 Tax=Pseudanabaena galeata UHCC 0370 TaxID=3110310 RepID=A0ABU5TKI5_9CYAN|nr:MULTISPECIES: dihydrolipoamide acetyltransferase family protein [Pseudanabaena]MEA5478784.1 dihydrolipoamide acetyltransferase family protein [Pseudanabaena galeata UHCC 0370]MEA5485530.1 dihydrolipoamide acetyltransferase family protein [Pseudanabaena sp. CCNP1317]WGS70670.1 dihydrolipoamide acetyltransferase family protein [Pseudanabaena galeata CCNP1313]
MIYEIFMPALSSTMTEGKITSWVKSPGDKVEKGETVVIVESDKADMDVETFYEGYLGVILTPAGESAPVGSAIAYVAETKEEIEEAKKKADCQSGRGEAKECEEPLAKLVSIPTAASTASIPEVVVSSPRKSSAPAPASGRQIVSPRAKRIAKDNGIDLAKISGTGPNGRVTAADVETFLSPASTSAAAPVAPVSSTPTTPTKSVAPAPAKAAAPVALGTAQSLTTLQKAVINNMNQSLSVPTFRVGYTITTDALDVLYKQVKSKGVTMTALLAKAVAVTLQKHPLVNASLSDRGIEYKSNINVAVAVAMDDGGLITPVLQNADQTDLYTLSRNWKGLVERARAKQLQPEEYNSGTFTISNLGMFGVDRFDAILPPGTGAILAVGGSRPQVVATKDGAIKVSSQMQVNLTADHRVIYGAHAAQFLQDLAKLIETNPQSLTL